MPIIASRIVDVCVFRFKNDRAEYLLLKRSHDEKIYPDLWQFVSGTIKDGEKAYEAARREVQEETGLAIRQLWVVPHVNIFYDHEYDSMNLSPFFAAQAEADKEPTVSAEHSLYAWLPFDDALRRLVWPAHRSGLEIVDRYILRDEEAGRRGMIPLG